MDKELDDLMIAAKAAAIAAHRKGYKIEWVGFQPESDDVIEVSIRVSKDVLVSIVKKRDEIHESGFPISDRPGE